MAVTDADSVLPAGPDATATAATSAGQDGAPLLEVRELSVRFGAADAAPVVQGVSLQLHRGECLALVGESGSGKSVTSRALVGLAGPGSTVQAEALAFAGQDLRTLPARAWQGLRGKRVGFVMQDALGALDPLRPIGLEIDETLRLHTALDRSARQARVQELLQAVGLPDPALQARQYPHQLSGGLRQRALIAAAIACRPELLIADEPTTALDAVVQAQILALLESLRDASTAMLVVSHDLAVVARLADRVAVMHQGRIVEQGPVDQVLRDPRHAYTRSLLDAARAVHALDRRAAASSAAVPSPAGPAAAPADQPEAWTPQPPPEQPALQATQLVKRFAAPAGARARTAVDGVSVTLRRGRTLGIVGESGSGKTTVARILLGLERPDAGQVAWQGQDWLGLGAAAQRALRPKVQVVFQDPLASFDPRYTVGRVLDEALALDATLTGSAQRLKRAAELLHAVRLPAALLSRRPIELSGGQRQRVAIARALAPRPEVLVCDEPVSALDVSVQAQILDLLDELKQRLQLSCLFISHDLGVIRRVSDDLVVMQHGRVVEAGPVDQVFERPQHAYTRALLAAIPRLAHVAPALS